MKTKNMTLAVRATTAAMVLGTAGQASAFDFTAGGVDASVYGFARVATSYDFDENIGTGGGRSADFSAISTDNADTVDGHFGMDAVTSRIGISAMTPQDVKVVVEMDYDGAGTDSVEPRLRHAYGEYKGVLVGRYWSNYTSFVGFSPTLDFDALPGEPGNQDRTEQIRYTTGPFSVAIEEPFGYTGVADGNPDSDIDKTSSPALTAKLEDSAGGLSYATGVMAKQTAVDDGSNNDDSAIGYGAFVAADMALADAFSVQATFNYSDGANYYVYRAGGNFGQHDAYLDGGEVETIESYGGTLGASMDLGGGRSVNAAYGTATTDLDDAVNAGAVTPDTTDTNTMAFVNYKWTPVKNVTMGIEFANLETETQGGNDGDANRLMYLAQYSF